MTKNIISLSSLLRAKPGESCGSRSGAGQNDNRPDGLSPAVWDKIKNHPCYSEEAHHYFARMHVAVAPSCNIQCNYCNRKFDCSNESRPGVVSEKLSPEQALRKVLAVASKTPQLSVLGIAGPGDALANPERTFRTFSLASKALPYLKLCLSTNGLALPDHIETIKSFNIDHVTITISAADPETGAKIYPWISHQGRRIVGEEASEILLARQMEGLEKLAAAGILVKVNSVLIPGVNDGSMIDINRMVRDRGAFLHNVMPLISDPAHGTHFGLTGQRGPTPKELRDAQDALGDGARLMRHCRQCRADAVGLLGEDLGDAFSLDKIEDAPEFSEQSREIYLQVIEQERKDRQKSFEEAAKQADEAAAGARVAVATKGGGRINQHFGHAGEFHIYRLEGRSVRFEGIRRVDNYCKNGRGRSGGLDEIAAILSDVDVVLAAKIGASPKARLAKTGLSVIDDYAHDYIETAILRWSKERSGANAARKASA